MGCGEGRGGVGLCRGGRGGDGGGCAMVSERGRTKCCNLKLEFEHWKNRKHPCYYRNLTLAGIMVIVIILLIFVVWDILKLFSTCFCHYLFSDYILLPLGFLCRFKKLLLKGIFIIFILVEMLYRSRNKNRKQWWQVKCLGTENGVAVFPFKYQPEEKQYLNLRNAIKQQSNTLAQ